MSLAQHTLIISKPNENRPSSSSQPASLVFGEGWVHASQWFESSRDVSSSITSMVWPSTFNASTGWERELDGTIRMDFFGEALLFLSVSEPA